MEVLFAVATAVVPLCVLVLVVFKCMDCLRKQGGFKNFENDESRIESRVNPGFNLGESADSRDQSALSTSIQIEPMPEIIAETTCRKPKIACVEKSKQESSLKLVVVNSHPFPRRQLKYLKEIGNGWFGQVLESDAEHITSGIPLSRVVAKSLKDDASNAEKKLFLEDVVPYRELEHSNILRLLGQCMESMPFLMVLEYAQLGNLKTYLMKHKDKSKSLSDNYQLVKFTIDAASGLACLHRHGYIHQDFAARNCLIMADNTLKVGDYGISEEVHRADYYESGKELLPIRWMAPESLSHQSNTWQTAVITKEANIWSFGVLVWEVMMFGTQPYTNMSDSEVLQNVIEDRLVKLPDPNSDLQHKNRIVEVMQFCWLNPGQRPNIEEAHSLLQRLYDIASGLKEKEDDFERKWNQKIPSEARVVTARPKPEEKMRPALASFDSNFAPPSKPGSQSPKQMASDELSSVKVEKDMSTSVVVEIPHDVSRDVDLASPFKTILPSQMTSTPLVYKRSDPGAMQHDVGHFPSSPQQEKATRMSSSPRAAESQTNSQLATSASLVNQQTKSISTSRKIEDEFDRIDGESKTTAVSIENETAAPKEKQDATNQELLSLEPIENDVKVTSEPNSSQKHVNDDLFGSFVDASGEIIDINNVVQSENVSADNDAMAVDLLRQVESSGQASNSAGVNLLGQGHSVHSESNRMDIGVDLLDHGDVLVKINGSEPLQEGPVVQTASSPKSSTEETHDQTESVGKQISGHNSEAGPKVDGPQLLQSSVDLLSSSIVERVSVVDKNGDSLDTDTFQAPESLTGNYGNDGKENVTCAGGDSPDKSAKAASEKCYPVDQTESSSQGLSASGSDSSLDGAVCVNSADLKAPSSFDGAAPSSDKVGKCVEYLSDDESKSTCSETKSTSSETNSTSDTSGSGNSYICDGSETPYACDHRESAYFQNGNGDGYVDDNRRHVMVTDLDADDDDSNEGDDRPHDHSLDSDSATDSDEENDFRTVSELYLTRGVSSSRIFESGRLETIPEDVMPVDSSSVDLKYDAQFDDVFSAPDTFEWDDFMGESIVGRDRTSHSPKHSFNMSDWTMDADSPGYRSSNSSNQSGSSATDVMGTGDHSLHLSTAHSPSEVKRFQGRTSRSRISDLITNRNISSITNTKPTRTPFYSLFEKIDFDSDSDSNTSPEPIPPTESRSTDLETLGLHDNHEDLTPGSPTDDSLFEQKLPDEANIVRQEDAHFLSSASDVTMVADQLRPLVSDPAGIIERSFHSLEAVSGDNEVGSVTPIVEPLKPKPKAKDLDAAFQGLASQHNIGFEVFSENTSGAEQYSDFTFESSSKTTDIDLFEDFPSPESNTAVSSRAQSVAAFLTGVAIPETLRSEHVTSIHTSEMSTSNVETKYHNTANIVDSDDQILEDEEYSQHFPNKELAAVDIEVRACQEASYNLTAEKTTPVIDITNDSPETTRNDFPETTPTAVIADDGPETITGIFFKEDGPETAPAVGIIEYSAETIPAIVITDDSTETTPGNDITDGIPETTPDVGVIEYSPETIPAIDITDDSPDTTCNIDITDDSPETTRNDSPETRPTAVIADDGPETITGIGFKDSPETAPAVGIIAYSPETTPPMIVTDGSPEMTPAIDIPDDSPETTSTVSIQDDSPETTPIVDITDEGPETTTAIEITNDSSEITPAVGITDNSPETTPAIVATDYCTKSTPTTDFQDDSLNTFPFIVITNDSPETTPSVGITDDVPETTTAIDITDESPETTPAVDITDDGSETTPAVGIIAYSPETTPPMIVTDDSPETTTAVSIQDDSPETTSVVDITDDGPETTTAIEIIDDSHEMTPAVDIIDDSPETTTAIEITNNSPEMTPAVGITNDSPETTTAIEIINDSPETTPVVDITDESLENTPAVGIIAYSPETTPPMIVTDDSPETTTAVGIQDDSPETTSVVDITDDGLETTTDNVITDASAETTPVVDIIDDSPETTTAIEIINDSPETTPDVGITDDSPAIVTTDYGTNSTPTPDFQGDILKTFPFIDITNDSPETTNAVGITDDSPETTTAIEITNDSPEMTPAVGIIDDSPETTTAIEITNDSPETTLDVDITDDSPALVTTDYGTKSTPTLDFQDDSLKTFPFIDITNDSLETTTAIDVTDDSPETTPLVDITDDSPETIPAVGITDDRTTANDITNDSHETTPVVDITDDSPETTPIIVIRDDSPETTPAVAPAIADGDGNFQSNSKSLGESLPSGGEQKKIAVEGRKELDATLDESFLDISEFAIIATPIPIKDNGENIEEKRRGTTAGDQKVLDITRDESFLNISEFAVIATPIPNKDNGENLEEERSETTPEGQKPLFENLPYNVGDDSMNKVIPSDIVTQEQAINLNVQSSNEGEFLQDFFRSVDDHNPETEHSTLDPFGMQSMLKAQPVADITQEFTVNDPHGAENGSGMSDTDPIDVCLDTAADNVSLLNVIESDDTTLETSVAIADNIRNSGTPLTAYAPLFVLEHSDSIPKTTFEEHPDSDAAKTLLDTTSSEAVTVKTTIRPGQFNAVGNEENLLTNQFGIDTDVFSGGVRGTDNAKMENKVEDSSLGQDLFGMDSFLNPIVRSEDVPEMQLMDDGFIDEGRVESTGIQLQPEYLFPSSSVSDPFQTDRLTLGIESDPIAPDRPPTKVDAELPLMTDPFGIRSSTISENLTCDEIENTPYEEELTQEIVPETMILGTPLLTDLFGAKPDMEVALPEKTLAEGGGIDPGISKELLTSTRDDVEIKSDADIIKCDSNSDLEAAPNTGEDRSSDAELPTSEVDQLFSLADTIEIKPENVEQSLTNPLDNLESQFQAEMSADLLGIVQGSRVFADTKLSAEVLVTESPIVSSNKQFEDDLFDASILPPSTGENLMLSDSVLNMNRDVLKKNDFLTDPQESTAVKEDTGSSPDNITSFDNPFTDDLQQVQPDSNIFESDPFVNMLMPVDTPQKELLEELTNPVTHMSNPFLEDNMQSEIDSMQTFEFVPNNSFSQGLADQQDTNDTGTVDQQLEEKETHPSQDHEMPGVSNLGLFGDAEGSGRGVAMMLPTATSTPESINPRLDTEHQLLDISVETNSIQKHADPKLEAAKVSESTADVSGDAADVSTSVETDDFFMVGSSHSASDASNISQSIIDFPDSSLSDSQESATFLDMPLSPNSNGEDTELIKQTECDLQSSKESNNPRHNSENSSSKDGQLLDITAPSSDVGKLLDIMSPPEDFGPTLDTLDTSTSEPIPQDMDLLGLMPLGTNVEPELPLTSNMFSATSRVQTEAENSSQGLLDFGLLGDSHSIPEFNAQGEKKRDETAHQPHLLDFTEGNDKDIDGQRTSGTTHEADLLGVVMEGEKSSDGPGPEVTYNALDSLLDIQPDDQTEFPNKEESHLKEPNSAGMDVFDFMSYGERSPEKESTPLNTSLVSQEAAQTNISQLGDLFGHLETEHQNVPTDSGLLSDLTSSDSLDLSLSTSQQTHSPSSSSADMRDSFLDFSTPSLGAADSSREGWTRETTVRDSLSNLAPMSDKQSKGNPAALLDLF